MEDCSQMSDEQVVKCVLDDSDYFFELIDRYQRKLFRYVRRITALTDVEISDILKKPMGSVATLINRAKKNFKEMMLKNNVTL